MDKTEITKNILSAVIITAAVAVVAWLGSVFVNLGMVWYDTLIKPSQYAPNAIFPIVWSVIYLSAIAILVHWTIKDALPTSTKVLSIINGVVNILWCLIFFTLGLTFLGLIVIITNLIAAILFFINFYKFNKIYGVIISIYPFWICIATSLNLSLWILN